MRLNSPSLRGGFPEELGLEKHVPLLAFVCAEDRLTHEAAPGWQNLAGQQVSGLLDVVVALPEHVSASFSRVLLAEVQQARESGLAHTLALGGAQSTAASAQNTKNSTKA